MEYIVTRCAVSVGIPPMPSRSPVSRSQSASNFSDLGQTQNSFSTDHLDKSYEDDRKNLVESIRNILIAKVETI